jgi:arabinofuranosyltransferase
LRNTIRQFWPLLPALTLYAILAHILNFTQDDAYISYRYVANYLNGHGLVYNVGERIEGFTNFGWTIYLILCGRVGLDFVFISKLTGFLFGGGIVVLTFLIARRVFGSNGFWFAATSVMLVGANQSLAYWAPAGLETAAFGFLALWALHLYLRRSWLLAFALVLAVWTRPEGVVVAGALILIEWVDSRRYPRFTLGCAAIAFVLSLPLVGFKLAYYGSLLPNPFYAKTSFTLEQLADGAAYTGNFLADYALWGVGLLTPLIFLKRLSREARAVWLFTVLYCLYVLGIGGDALRVHRFFVPVFGLSAILLLLAFSILPVRLKLSVRYLVLAVVTAGLLALTYWMPRQEVTQYNYRERAFVAKMTFRAKALKASDQSNFSVALPTIGVFGYELPGHTIIDLVGLTDSTIARHPEVPIPGMESPWRERKYNSAYVLGREPDYILFSTDIKPSAPAERALLLYRQFQDCYRSISWLYAVSRSGGPGITSVAFKRRRPVTGELVPRYPVRFVDLYKRSLELYSEGNISRALEYCDSSLSVSPKPYYVNLLVHRGYALAMLGHDQEGTAIMEELLDRDSTIYEAHMYLYRYALYQRNLERAIIHRRWLQALVPWYWPEIEAQARKDYGITLQGN